MDFTLRDDRGVSVEYGEREKKIFALIPKDGRQIETTVLVERFWKKVGDPPYTAQITAMGYLRSLRKKVVENKEKFKIEVSRKRGPHPQKVWIAKP